jgi:hypothetical protein
MTEEVRLALLHAPLLGPSSWAPTAQELRGRGAKVIVPNVRDRERGEPPYWRRYLECLRAQVLDTREPLIAVGQLHAADRGPRPWRR